MKRLLLAIVAAVAALAFAVPALADTAPAPTNPWPGKHLDVMLYVDNVWGTHPKYGVNPGPNQGCAVSNLFKRGQQVVFRMWGVETSTGDILTPDTIKYAYVKIPGQPNQAFTFAKHGKADNSPWFWTTAFEVPKDYPLGVVNFRVVVKTKSAKFGEFDQSALSPTSQLTITP